MPTKDETTGFIETFLYMLVRGWVIMLAAPIVVPGFAPGFYRCVVSVFAVETLLGAGVWVWAVKRGSDG